MPRAFYCTKMCEKSKSTTFSYYKNSKCLPLSGSSFFAFLDVLAWKRKSEKILCLYRPCLCESANFYPCQDFLLLPFSPEAHSHLSNQLQSSQSKPYLNGLETIFWHYGTFQLKQTYFFICVRLCLIYKVYKLSFNWFLNVLHFLDFWTSQAFWCNQSKVFYPLRPLEVALNQGSSSQRKMDILSEWRHFLKVLPEFMSIIYHWKQYQLFVCILLHPTPTNNLVVHQLF